MGAEATQISAFTAAAAHTLCFAGLAVAHSLAGRGALVSDPALALRLLVVCEAPLVIVVFSLLRRDPKHCSFLKAAARGLLGLPIGSGQQQYTDRFLCRCSHYFTSSDVVEYMISVPSHGAVIGAWLGAWPMPLDWERPWQEWPICVSYGAIAGHLIGMVLSLILIVAQKRRVRIKAD
ncbi:hypothetical protein ACQ4PT_038947 [Festuca glaucescens]